MIRDSDWSIGSPARENLWRELCRHHSREKDFDDQYYWDTVKQIYSSTGENTNISKTYSACLFAHIIHLMKNPILLQYYVNFLENIHMSI